MLTLSTTMNKKNAVIEKCNTHMNTVLLENDTQINEDTLLNALSRRCTIHERQKLKF